MKFFIFFAFACLMSLTTYSQMSWNNAYSFNGTSAYYACPHNVDFNNLTTQATWEFWVRPNVHSLAVIVGKNYASAWAVGTTASGQIFIQTPGGAVISTPTLPTGVWSHVAITYNNGTVVIYFNGTSVSQSGSITSGPLPTNTDSVYIGCDRNSGVPAFFFNGALDNIRIWSVARTAAQIQEIRFTPIQMPGVNLGPYSGLQFSSHGDVFTNDWSGITSTSLFARGGATTINYSQQPLHFNDYNSNYYFDGTSYLSAATVTEANVTTAITVEAWIKRDTTGTQPAFQNIFNKSGGTDRFDWGLYINSTGTLFFTLNSDANFVSAPSIITRGQWYHVAGTWSQSSGRMRLYVNGDSVAGANFTGTISNNPDSICIGGIAATNFIANKFKGQIDNPRIWSVERTAAQIREGMYINNSPASGSPPFNNLEFSFDALTNMPRLASAHSYYLLLMAFRGNGIRLVSSHLNNDLFLTSPLIRDADLQFPAPSANWFMSTKRAYMPDPGIYRDSIFISPAQGGLLQSLKVFVLINHTWISDLTITLRNPAGTTVTLTPTYTHSANDMMVVFDQLADTLISGFLGQAQYSPRMRPANTLAVFNNTQSAGWWLLTINDGFSADQGYIHGWGIFRNLFTSNGNEITEIPNRFYLNQNYPNPFNPVTTIKFGLAKDAMTKITVYDILGREIQTLVNEFRRAGNHEISFDGSNLSSGTYFYRIEAGEFVETRKMILVK